MCLFCARGFGTPVHSGVLRRYVRENTGCADRNPRFTARSGRFLGEFRPESAVKSRNRPAQPVFLVSRPFSGRLEPSASCLRTAFVTSHTVAPVAPPACPVCAADWADPAIWKRKRGEKGAADGQICPVCGGSDRKCPVCVGRAGGTGGTGSGPQSFS